MSSKFIKLVIFICLPTILLLGITHYQASSSDKVIIEGMVGQPRHLNPVQISDNAVDRDLVTILYRSLFKYDEMGILVPDLAASYEVSDDGLTYTVHLSDKQSFDDGVQITTNDVIFTASKLPGIKDVRIEKQDDLTVKFILTQAYYGFPELLTFPVAAEHLGTEEKPLSKFVSSTGFYVSAIDPAPNHIESITLRRREFSKDFVNTIVFKFYNDRDELKTALELGEIDMYAGSEISWPHFNEHSTVLNGVDYAIYFNLNHAGVWTDLDSRKVLAAHIPKEMIVTQALENRYQLMNGPLSGEYARNIDPYPFVTETTNLSGNINFVVPRTEDNLKVAEIIKSEWEKLGLEVQLKVVDPDDLDDKIMARRDFDAILLGHEVSHDPDRYNYWHSAQVTYPGLNISGYKQVRVDKAIEKGRQEKDPSKRKEHYNLFQDSIVDDVPAIYLYQPRYSIFARDNIEGINLGVMYYPSERYRSLPQWSKE